MSQSLSIVIICKNEERVIARCIEAIHEDIREYDEIIVVDTGSTDNTLSILATMKNIKILHFDWKDDFAEARNFGISNSIKDWVFFIDSDEILIKGSIDHLDDAIKNTLKHANDGERIVFAPKIINTDDSVLYNAGRILPNDNTVKFEGVIHEYPTVIGESLNLVSIKMPKIVVKHDGYEDSVIKNKNKALRNTTLIEKILKQNPNDSRYYYFYYRDAKPMLTDQEYEQGMLNFFKKFPADSYSNQVAKDLGFYYLSKNKNDEAEKYITMLFESAERGTVEDRSVAIYLTGIKEIQKLKAQQKELLRLLIYTRDNVLNQEESLFENGYAFDDLIGLLFFQLEDYKTAYEIAHKLNANNFSANLPKMLKKLDQIYK